MKHIKSKLTQFFESKIILITLGIGFFIFFSSDILWPLLSNADMTMEVFLQKMTFGELVTRFVRSVVYIMGMFICREMYNKKHDK